MASFCHGGDAIVSAKVQLGDGGSGSAIDPRGLKMGVGGKDSAIGIHGNIDYDSSSSPYDMSSLGDNDSDYEEKDDDSDYGEKDDEKNYDASALVGDEVIENISPLARDDGSVSSFFHAKGTFSKASFGVIGDNSCVRILKRDSSATISPSFTSSLGGKMEVNDGALGDGVWGQNGNSRGLPIMVENMNSKIPNQINDDNLLPCLNSNIPNYDPAFLASVDVNGAEFGNQINGNIILPNLDSATFGNSCDHDYNKESDCVNANSIFGSMLEGNIGGGVIKGSENGKFPNVTNAKLVAGLIHSDLPFENSESDLGNKCLPNFLSSCLENGDVISVSNKECAGCVPNGKNINIGVNMETNKSGEINSISDFGKHDLSTNVDVVQGPITLWLRKLRIPLRRIANW